MQGPEGTAPGSCRVLCVVKSVEMINFKLLVNKKPCDQGKVVRSTRGPGQQILQTTLRERTGLCVGGYLL